MDLGLTGKGALVTGASMGIGKAVARALAENGVDVAICARRQEELEKTASEIAEATRRNIVPIAADMGSHDHIQRFVRVAIERLGRIDVLVTGAGAVQGGPLLELPDDAFVDAIQVKLLGYIRCARAVVPHMRQRGGGSIIMISGSAAREPRPGAAPRGIVNSGINNFAKSLSDAVAKDNIRVVGISPGPVDTEATQVRAQRISLEGRRPIKQVLQDFAAGIPIGRLGQPKEIANLILFLASERARFITGTTIIIDGASGRVAF